MNKPTLIKILRVSPSYQPIITVSATLYFFFFFFNDTATTEIYTLSLHDALPILPNIEAANPENDVFGNVRGVVGDTRSEEHTSELQSRLHLVCRLLLEKKKKKNVLTIIPQNSHTALDIVYYCVTSAQQCIHNASG